MEPERRGDTTPQDVRPSWETTRPQVVERTPEVVVERTPEVVESSAEVIGETSVPPSVGGPGIEVRLVERVSGHTPQPEPEPEPEPQPEPAPRPAPSARPAAVPPVEPPPPRVPAGHAPEPFGRAPIDLPGRLTIGDTRISNRTAGLFALVAVVPVISAIGVAVLISMGTGSPGDGGSSSEGSSSDAGSSADAGSGGSDGGSGSSGGGAVKQPAGVREAKLDDAGDALRGAGIRRVGKVEGAWTWRDGDTETVVVLSRRVTRRNGDFSARAVALRATTITDPNGDPKVLASAEDEGPVCPRGTEMKAEIGARNATVRDIDGDGVHEVLVSWQHACGSDVRRRVTVLSGPTPYVLEGQGALTAEPDPPIADWPDGFLDAAGQAFDRGA